jgi:hypothetical protein
LAVGKWKDKIKCKNDDRNFLLYPQKNKLYALAINSDREQDFIDAYKLQKMRWPSNEGVIKILVNEFDFNMNTGNGTKIINNPKIQNIHKESDKKIQNYDNHIEKLKDSKHFSNGPKGKIKRKDSIDNWENRKVNEINEVNKQVLKIPKKSQDRLLEPQSLMSGLKMSIFNLMMFLIMKAFDTDNPLKYGVEAIKDLLINRSGEIIETENEIVYIFSRSDYKKHMTLLKDFLDGVSALELKDKHGRKVLAKVSSRAP